MLNLRHISGDHLIDRIDLDDPPQPGRWFVVEEQSFLVMQRRHRYALRNGRYVMASVALMVKPQARPADATPWRHGWVIGDPDLSFQCPQPFASLCRVAGRSLRNL